MPGTGVGKATIDGEGKSRIETARLSDASPGPHSPHPAPAMQVLNVAVIRKPSHSHLHLKSI